MNPATALPETLRVDEQTVLRQPRSRVWQAFTRSEEMASWFNVDIAGQEIAVGKTLRGNFLHKGFEHAMFDAIVEEMVPEERFSWRWHPHAVEVGVDYSDEPRTLVTFTLSDAPGGGTLLRVVETGFEGLSEARRAFAFNAVKGGWPGIITKRIPAFLDAN